MNIFDHIEQKYVKRPCRRCGEPAYILCRIGNKHVCHECFSAACEKQIAKQPPAPTRFRLSAGNRDSAHA